MCKSQYQWDFLLYLSWCFSLTILGIVFNIWTTSQYLNILLCLVWLGQLSKFQKWGRERGQGMVLFLDTLLWQLNALGSSLFHKPAHCLPNNSRQIAAMFIVSLFHVSFKLQQQNLNSPYKSRKASVLWNSGVIIFMWDTVTVSWNNMFNHFSCYNFSLTFWKNIHKSQGWITRWAPTPNVQGRALVGVQETLKNPKSPPKTYNHWRKNSVILL